MSFGNLLSNDNIISVSVSVSISVFVLYIIYCIYISPKETFLGVKSDRSLRKRIRVSSHWGHNLDVCRSFQVCKVLNPLTLSKS